MAITYSYKITQLERAPKLGELTDVITRVRFTYTGKDTDGLEGSFQGAIPMPAPDADNFTPLASLTEAEVIEWVKVTHPIAHMQEQIQKQIDRQRTPKYEATDLPWGNPVVEPPVTTTPKA